MTDGLIDTEMTDGLIDTEMTVPVVTPVPGGVSIVRRNLMERAGYSPYCGSERCYLHMPRTTWDGSQFKCRCGWRSEFPSDFVAAYKARWKK